MLMQRVITAIVLLVVLLAALFAPMNWPFTLLTLVLIAAAGWEWGRLNGAKGVGAVALGLVVAGACGLGWWANWVGVGANPAWWIAFVLWVLAGALALRLGPGAWPKVPQFIRLLLGVVMLWVAWLALASAKVMGLNFLLSVFCLVWVSDIAAYAGGRTFGRRKLAPAISPGKSWEGVFSGMLGVLVLAFAWMALEPSLPTDSASLFTLLQQRQGWVGMVVALVFLAAMGVVGDLIESLVKRAAGAKDSSQLLPGHGGVLDRVDALLPVFPIAMALSTL